jgi:hypothetical protein
MSHKVCNFLDEKWKYSFDEERERLKFLKKKICCIKKAYWLYRMPKHYKQQELEIKCVTTIMFCVYVVVTIVCLYLF